MGFCRWEASRWDVPVCAYYDKSQGIIVDKDGNKVTGEVLFGQPKNYDLYIAGTRVNTSNLSDVLGDGGSVSFNGIDKLTLKNANIDGGTSQYGIDARFPINILLEGENNVNGYWGIVFVGESHIKGPGSLNVSGSRGIVFNSPVIFIEDSAQVSVEGTERHAIAKRNSSSEEVVIRGSETFVRLKGVYGAVDIKRLTLKDNLQIALPKGAYFKDEWDGIVRMGSVTPVTIKNEWVTIANQDFVDANNKDADGNIIYNIAFAGDTITSAIANDLTVLPAISLNTEGGYARYDATDNSLHLSGVDIEVDADTKAHALDISTFRDASIVLGSDPVCIYSNYYDSSDLTIGIQGLHRSGNQQSHLTITTEEDAEADGNFFISAQGYSFVAECGVTIAGKAKVSIESARKSAFSLAEAGGQNLTLKEDAGLTLTAKQEPMWMTYNCQLVMEDGIGILQPFGTTYSEDKRSLVDADGKQLTNTTVVIGKSTGYGIYIAGTEVNDTNQNDVLGDGSVSYNPETSVLTLTNANIDGGTAEYGILAYEPITLTVEGENEVKGIYGLYANDQTTIGGTGSLSFQGETGIYSSAPGITIEGGIHLYAEGTAGIGMAGKNASAGGITVRGEETIVEMKGTESPYDFQSLTLEDGLAIAYPQRASYSESKGCIVNAWGSVVTDDWVIIRKFQAYNLFVAGTQVTDINQDDVLDDGTVSYDPETNTLTLTNANIEGTINAESMPGLSVNLIGENRVVTDDTERDGIHFSSISSSTIDGPGSLEVRGGVGINSTGGLTISGGANVSVEGTNRWAIRSQLTVSGEETIVAMKSAESVYLGSILTLNDGLAIRQPKGAHFDSESSTILDADGNPIKDEWVIIKAAEKPFLYIAGTEVTEANRNDVLGDGTVSFDGEKVLTLNGLNYDIDYWDDENGIIYSNIPLEIKLVGENKVGGLYGIYIEAEDDEAEVRITGPGSLYAEGFDVAIYTSVRLAIADGAQVKAEGDWDMGTAISASAVTISGRETVVMLSAGISTLHAGSLTLEDDLTFWPEGAHFGTYTYTTYYSDDEWEEIGIVDAHDNGILQEWVVIASQDYITGIDSLTPAAIPEGEGAMFNLAGQRIGRPVKGINIIGRKKILMK